MMFFDYIFAILYVMMYLFSPFIVVLIISLVLIKKKPEIVTYKKPKTELEEILGF